MRRLIGLLQESLPGVKLHTVALDETTTQPIAEIVAQLPDSIDGPVMVTGLERSNPSSAPEHPVLQTLNLSRPEWPKRLPQPVVLWVPEYLLGLLGREAPDFLDWRSDTLYFPEELGAQDLAALSSILWRSRASQGRTKEPDRRARIDELQSRLAASFDHADVIQCNARARWWSELGNHLRFLGRLQEAESAFRSALALEEAVANEKGIAADLNNLAVLYMQQGEWEQADSLLREVQARFEDVGSKAGAATSLLNLAKIFAERDDAEEAERAIKRALHYLGDSSNDELRTEALRFGGYLALRRGDLESARQIFHEVYEKSFEAQDLSAIAAAARSLGVLDALAGNIGSARSRLETALMMEDEVGDVEGKASTLSVMGGVETVAGDYEKARTYWSDARSLLLKMGNLSGAENLQAQLRGLDGMGTG